MTRILFLLIICFIADITSAFGQKFDDLHPRFGVSAYGFFNIHSVNFSSLPGVPNCCPEFGNGEGFAPGVGLLFESPIAEKWQFGTRLTYNELGARLSADESVYVLVNGALRQGIFQHSIDSRIASVAIEPSLIFSPATHLFFLGGFSAEIIISDAFRQKEIILEPDDGIFTDTHSRRRNEYYGDIPDINRFQAATVFGLSYDLPLNNRNSMFMSPEIIFKYTFTDISAGVASWKAHAVRFGLSFKFASEPQMNCDLPQEKEYEPLPALAEEKNANDTNDTVKIKSVAAEFENTLSTSEKYKKIQPIIRINEVLSKQIYPILNYIFFGESSDEIPARYHQISADSIHLFNAGHMHETDVLPMYYEILNIVGARLSAQTSATLTITGCNADIDSEKGNLALSARRAVAVKQYLIKNWNIDSARLSVIYRNKPEKPTLGAGEYCNAENRRVELTSNSDLIFAPCIFGKTTYLTDTPNVELKIKDSAANIDILAKGKKLRSFKINSGKINWNIASETDEILKDISTCDSLLFRAKSPSGNVTEYSVPVEVVNIKENSSANGLKTDNYRLILFDFNSSELNDANQSVAMSIRKNISENSKITIRGYADGIGGKMYNKTLSEMRARKVADAIGAGNADVFGTDGVYLYNNDLPEYRFYNRTVNVIVETPELQK
ncbi:hypothetical protein MASR2M18_10470 [Ignavibacteria bacterium]|nr:OmpA family protein [Bacteroidota bacterium]MCZ2133494.1 OmpA family protein [Bacteroidota bacterium]